MIERATGHAGTLFIAYCLDSTLRPTLELLRSILREQSKDNTMRTTPLDAIPPGLAVTAIAAGFYHTCALTSSGGIK